MKTQKVGTFRIPGCQKSVHRKPAVSAQKALQGSETEMRELLGGTEESSVSRPGVIDLPSMQINDFSQRGNRKKLN